MKQDKVEMAAILKQYKLPQGKPNYPTLWNIPSDERIPALAQKDFKKINAALTVALTMAFESMNLKRGMNEMQILDLSEAIIDTSTEDNLSFEDVCLFLQYVVRGKYELSYESIDVPKFMRMFELYRQERHEAIVQHREDEFARLDSFGDPTNRIKASTLFDEQMASYIGRIQEKNDEIKLLRREANERKK